MRERSDCTLAGGGTPAVNGAWVSIFVGDDHPLLRLKQALDWAAITEGMVTQWRRAGKNVDGGPGRPWPVPLYVPLLVLMWVKAYHARQMEDYISESVVARRFLALQDAELRQIRDHSSIARAEAALGAAGKAAVNALVIQTAAGLKFTNGQTLSSDTTVQEPAIGYPNEPGILKGWAERIERALKKLKARGVWAAKAGIAQAQEVYRRVKQHHLFAKTTAEKQKILAELVTQSAALHETTQAVIAQVSARCGRVKQRAAATLRRLVAVSHTLLPQIRQWMKTGKVATEKILHAGLSQARAIPKGKGRVKFGMKWLIHRLTGGYLFGHRVAPRADENQMPAESVKDYRALFGPKATPKLVVYDRGASLPAAAAQLKQAGVRKVGIPPRGQGTWLVGKKDQQVVKSQRGQTEGSIGRLKSKKYGFSHRQERCVETQDAAGQRAIVAVNLNTLMRDVVAQAKSARGACD
jgi:rhodanese-related sulfurtransferase